MSKPSLVDGATALPLPRHITDAGSLVKSLRTVAGALSDTQVVTHTAEVEGWLGVAASRHAGETEEIRNAVMRINNVAAQFATVLEQYQEEYDSLIPAITRYQADWDDLVAAYSGRVDTLEAELSSMAQGDTVGSFIGIKTKIALEAETLEEEQRSLTRRYNVDVEAVDSAAARARSALAASVDAVVPRTEAFGVSFPPSRGNVGVALFGHGRGLLAAGVLMADAREDAPVAAAAAKRLLDGDVDAEALEEFDALYGERLAHDPFFATVFCDEFGADNMVRLARDASEASSVSGNESTEYIDRAKYQGYQKVLGSIGAATIIATGGTWKVTSWESESTDRADAVWAAWEDNREALKMDGASLKEWREEFNREIVKAGRNTDIVGPSGLYGYSYLAQEWGAGAQRYPGLSWGDDFLNGPNSPARDLLLWDSEGGFERFGRGDDRSLPIGTTSTWDPVHNLTLGLDGNVEATRPFMAADLEFKGGNTGVTEYLVGRRYVAGHAVAMGIPSPDQGDQLGRVIDEVTSVDPLLEYADPDSPMDGDRPRDPREDPDTLKVVRDFLKGYQYGLDNTGSYGGESRFGSGNSALRHWAGPILEEYTADIALESSVPTGVPGADGVVYDPFDRRYHLALTEELVAHLYDKDSGFFTDLAFDSPTIVPDIDLERIESVDTLLDSVPALERLGVSVVDHMREDLILAELVEDSDNGGKVQTAFAKGYGKLLSAVEYADSNAYIAQGRAIDDEYRVLRKIWTLGGDSVLHHPAVSNLPVGTESVDWFYDAVAPTDEEEARRVLADESELDVRIAKRDIIESIWYDSYIVKEALGPDDPRPVVRSMEAAEYGRLLPADQSYVDPSTGDLIAEELLTLEQREALAHYSNDVWVEEGLKHWLWIVEKEER